MTNTPTKIIERIKALLALASNNPSEAEAASAASRAAALMAEHHLAQAEIEAAGGAAEDDSIGVDAIEDGNGRKETWKGVLVFGIKSLFDVHTIPREDGSVGCFGRLSDVQTVKYTYAYLTNEIENQAQRYWLSLGSVAQLAGPGKRAALNGFRRAAAARLQERMLEARAEQDKIKRAAHASASPGALLVIQRGALEVESAWSEFCKANGFRVVSRHPAGPRESDATRAGRAAGDSMRIGGGGAQLGAEARRLGGRS